MSTPNRQITPHSLSRRHLKNLTRHNSRLIQRTPRLSLILITRHSRHTIILHNMINRRIIISQLTTNHSRHLRILKRTLPHQLISRTLRNQTQLLPTKRVTMTHSPIRARNRIIMETRPLNNISNTKLRHNRSLNTKRIRQRRTRPHRSLTTRTQSPRLRTTRINRTNSLTVRPTNRLSTNITNQRQRRIRTHMGLTPRLRTTAIPRPTIRFLHVRPRKRQTRRQHNLTLTLPMMNNNITRLNNTTTSHVRSLRKQRRLTTTRSTSHRPATKNLNSTLNRPHHNNTRTQRILQPKNRRLPHMTPNLNTINKPQFANQHTNTRHNNDANNNTRIRRRLTAIQIRQKSNPQVKTQRSQQATIKQHTTQRSITGSATVNFHSPTVYPANNTTTPTKHTPTNAFKTQTTNQTTRTHHTIRHTSHSHTNTTANTKR